MRNLIFILLFLINCVDYYREEITLPKDSNYQCEVAIKTNLGKELKKMSGDCDTLRAFLEINQTTIISIGEKTK